MVDVSASQSIALTEAALAQAIRKVDGSETIRIRAITNFDTLIAFFSFSASGTISITENTPLIGYLIDAETPAPLPLSITTEADCTYYWNEVEISADTWTAVLAGTNTWTEQIDHTLQ